MSNGRRSLLATAAAALVMLASTGAAGARSPRQSSPVEPTVDSTFIAATDASRIIPVNGDLAEVVYALGFGEQVVATDISATYPDAAAASPKIGYQRALNAETLLAFEPTLVITDDRAGPPEVFDLLRSANVEVAMIPYHADIHAPAYKIRAVAATLGAESAGEELVAAFEAQLAAAGAITAHAGTGDSNRPLVMALYLRGTGVQLVFGDGSGIDAVIEAAGGVDGGTELGVNGNAELSTEAIVDAAPEYFLVTTTGLESVGGIDGLLQIPGLAETPAGRNRAVLVYEDQYLYGLGPRTGELVRDLAAAFHPDHAPAASPASSAPAAPSASSIPVSSTSTGDAP